MKLSKSLLRRKRKSESWFKYLAFLLHLWLGLLSALVLVVVCLTGAIYALRPIANEMVYRKLLAVEANSNRVLPIDSLVANFKTTYQVTPYSVSIASGNSTRLSYYKRGENSIQAYMNPYTGEVLGKSSKSFQQFFKTTLYLHRWLLVFNPGRTIVGASVLIFVFLLVSGLVLWCPKSMRALKDGLKLNFKIKGYKLIHRLHHVLGFYSLLALLLLSITGLYFSFHWVRSGLVVAMGGESLQKRNHKKTNKTKPTTANFIEEQKKKNRIKPIIENQLATANQILAYSGKTIIYMPRGVEDGIKIKRYNTDNWLSARLPDAIEFKASGEIDKIERFKDLPLHKQFRSIIKPLHTGELFGPIGCILYSIISLIGASLPITGFLMWWRKLK